MRKKILFFTVILILATLILEIGNIAYANTKNENLNNIQEEYIMPIDTNTITSQSFLLYYNDFRVYNPTEFSQFYTGNKNNCGINFVANVLSYYKRLGFNLYNGEITQSIYDEIASLIKYDTNKGSHVYNLFNGIKTFAERAGYKAYTDDYILDLWSDVTRDIKLGYPVLADNGDHGYMVVGYRIIDGVKQLYVVTNKEGANYAWVNFDGAGFQMRSYHITY